MFSRCNARGQANANLGRTLTFPAAASDTVRTMPQDHYVAQTYLKAFADPTTVKDPKKGGQIHAYRKSDRGYFFPFASAICKTLDWDTTEKYLSPPDALGQWLKIYEPHWAAAVDRLSTNHHLSSVDKFLIAGYWAYLSTCTPTWQRVAKGIQQTELEETHLEKFIEYALAHPEQRRERSLRPSTGMPQPRAQSSSYTCVSLLTRCLRYRHSLMTGGSQTLKR
jgi:hypothetical protein